MVSRKRKRNADCKAAEDEVASSTQPFPASVPLLVFLNIPEPSYHRVFHLDGLYVQVVLCRSGGAAVQHFVIPLEPVSVPLVILAVVPGPRGPRQEVATLLLGDVRLRAVDRLHVLSERAWICVALCTTRDLANVRFLQMKHLRNDLMIQLNRSHLHLDAFSVLKVAAIFFAPTAIMTFNVWHHHSCGEVLDAHLVGMRPVLMFGSVRGVGEGFVAALVLAYVRLLSSVRAQMSLQVLQTRVGLGAALKLQTKTHSVDHLLFCSLASILQGFSSGVSAICHLISSKVSKIKFINTAN